MDSKSKTAYDRGYRAGQSPTPAKITAADRRREHSLWYVGFFDAESGAGRYAGVDAATYAARNDAEIARDEYDNGDRL